MTQKAHVAIITTVKIKVPRLSPIKAPIVNSARKVPFAGYAVGEREGHDEGLDVGSAIGCRVGREVGSLYG